jgi:hypothetical protein
MRKLLPLLVMCLWASPAPAVERPPIYLWFEPEWFEGVQGSFAYWPGTAKPTGSWGIAGPGISPEWTQGGESEWNSMGVPAAETKARCHRDFIVPRAGKYKIWVRYVDHRKKTEPFRVIIEQGGKAAVTGELGIKPVVPVNDEFQLFWGFSFGWGAIEGKLDKGKARLVLAIEKPGEAWRQLDAVLITDDEDFVPVDREKPTFDYYGSMNLQPAPGTKWRASGKDIKPGENWKRPVVGGKDFSMWTGVDSDPKWWGKQNLDQLKLYDVFFEFSPPTDIKKDFHKQFAGRKDVPIMSWPGLNPGFYLGTTPDLSPDSPVRKWLERTKTPFFIMTNYASGNYTDKNGPATYAALSGPLANQFLGFIHGEAIGTGGVTIGDKALGATRRAHVDALVKSVREQQAKAWTKIFKTPVPDDFMSKSISCLSVDSIALAHLFHQMGAKTVGYEIDATNVHAPMRIAFERGAARQYGGAWINYASGNFGDACNYFSQNPQVPRGAQAWFHSKYSETDGVTASWYRKLYYLNYLGGASAIYWEQNLVNQYMKPGPGTHPIQLSPFGRATEDFMAFASALPDRGDPLTPFAVLLNYGHSYERVNYACKMLNVFREDTNDLELRELFNVLWYPSPVLEGKPAAPDVQSMPGSVYGNIFDVLVDRPDKAKAVFNYPVLWAAGDVKLDGPWQATLKDYLQRGGTLVVNIATAADIPPALLGVKNPGKAVAMEDWSPDGKKVLLSVPYDVVPVELAGAEVLAWAHGKTPLITRHQVGGGAVILTLVPYMLCQDERAHPALPYLVNGLTNELLPVQVLLKNGKRPEGEIMYQVNKTKDGYLVFLVNTRGLDKTQTGLARVDHKAFVDVVVRTSLKVSSAKEYTQMEDLKALPSPGGNEIHLRIHPGDVQAVYLVAKE